MPTASSIAQNVGKACLNLAGKTSLAVLGGVISQLMEIRLAGLNAAISTIEQQLSQEDTRPTI